MEFRTRGQIEGEYAGIPIKRWKPKRKRKGRKKNRQYVYYAMVDQESVWASSLQEMKTLIRKHLDAVKWYPND